MENIKMIIDKEAALKVRGIEKNCVEISWHKIKDLNKVNTTQADRLSRLSTLKLTN